jgi:hypothetical protein
MVLLDCGRDSTYFCIVAEEAEQVGLLAFPNEVRDVTEMLVCVLTELRMYSSRASRRCAFCMALCLLLLLVRENQRSTVFIDQGEFIRETFSFMDFKSVVDFVEFINQQDAGPRTFKGTHERARAKKRTPS